MDYRAIDLTEIKEYSPFILAGMVGIKHPDRADTWGAVTLSELRDEILDAWNEGRFEHDSDRLDTDVINEVVGSTLRSDSGPIWEAWHELEMWGRGWPDISETEPGVYTFTGTLEDMARTMLEETLENLGREIIGEVRQVLAAWECPTCGDTGDPRICWPGEPCNDPGDQRTQPGMGIYPRLAEPADRHPDAQITGYRWEAEPVQASRDQVEHVLYRDPILPLIEQVEAQRATKPVADDAGTTQGFLVRMSKINAEEFAEQRRRDRIVGWAGLTLITLACLGVLIAWVVLG